MGKLTLSADDAVIRVAKEYAKTHNTNVSAMFARFVRGVQARSADFKPNERPSTLNRLRGAISLPEGMDYNDLRGKILRRRHGGRT